MSNHQVKRTARNSYIAKADDEIINTQTFPQLYLEAPTRAQELISKVSGVTVTKTANEFPQYLLKTGTATELRSKFVDLYRTWCSWMEEWH
ncbi:MAG: hypothetical protein QXL06_02045 [Nitrososphaerota archaeon]